ncbi:MAG: substrate-binding domain-containing protein [Fimbriimonadales bacterium]
MRINSLNQLLCGLVVIAALAGCSSGDSGSAANAGGGTTPAPSGSTGPATPGGNTSTTPPGTTAISPAKSGIKIAFIVKKPDEPWFQLETRFAQEAADKDGFELLAKPAIDSASVIPAIDNVAAQGAQGLVICTPDVNLGRAIVNECKKNNIKLMTVDDQLLGQDKKFLDVPHVGISAHNIGLMVGETLVTEMKKRGWKPEETGMLVVTYEELDTARERTNGEIEAAEKGGFLAANVFKTAEKGQDISDSRTAASTVLTQHPQLKNWLVTSMNDAGCLGAVRATEAYNLSPDHVIGIGINGDKGAIDDLKKPSTGLFGTVLLQAKVHGYDTSDMMFHWIKDGKAPPPITYTKGVLMTRENFEQVLKSAGLTD